MKRRFRILFLLFLCIGLFGCQQNVQKNENYEKVLNILISSASEPNQKEIQENTKKKLEGLVVEESLDTLFNQTFNELKEELSDYSAPLTMTRMELKVGDENDSVYVKVVDQNKKEKEMNFTIHSNEDNVMTSLMLKR